MKTGKAEMSWRKNGFGYLMWFLYTLLTGIALAGLGGVLCARAGGETYWGILFAAVVLAAAGGISRLIHRFGSMPCFQAEKRPKGMLVLEWMLTAVLLVVGYLFRVWQIDSAGGGVEYYEAARVVTGGKIPQIVHGAVYFYIQVLHGAFRLLGNQYIVGIWLQIALQLAGALGLFFVVRKRSGVVAALVTFGFCMCGPFMVSSSLVLSPEILYFVLMVAAAAVTLFGHWGRLWPMRFLFIGLLAALCSYLDVIGILLLPLALFTIFGRQSEEEVSGKKPAAVLLCVIGLVLGMMICIFTDAFLSGKTFQGVVNAWLRLYRPDGFILPLSLGEGNSWLESFLLFTGMAFGIFGFWYDRQEERISLLMFLILLVGLGACGGILTEEMPGFGAFYLLLALAAGQGLEQCLRGKVVVAEKTGRDAREEGFGVLAGEKEGFSESESLERTVFSEKLRAEADKAFSEEGSQEPDVRGPVQYLDNPLPLPRKHVKHVMDFPLNFEQNNDDFDYPIADEDDFDI